MNLFAYSTAAERYAKGRPFFHSLAVEKIQRICCAGGRIDRALDVGCGTGQSTLALLAVANEIVGLDSSVEMLSHAARHPRIRYLLGASETMPLDEATFSLVTVALAFHWFDQRKFMLEAHRVLRPGGWLVIYNDGFTGRMKGNDDCEVWDREQYLVRYPTPPRNNRDLTGSDAAKYGFTPLAVDRLVHEVEFTPEQLVAYLLTQTNVIAAVEAGAESAQSVAEWLLNSVQAFFRDPAERFLFSCQIRFFQRQ